MRALTDSELEAYDVLPRLLAERVRIVKVPLLAPGTAGMTLGRFVLLSTDTDHDGTRQLLAHELVHVRQWHELGVPRFLYRYLRSYAKQLVRHRHHQRAYRSITFEVEAYDEAEAWAGRMHHRP